MSTTDIRDDAYAGWAPPDVDVAKFLDDFDTRTRVEGGTAEAFADSFMALDPARAITLTPSMLAAALPARRAMFEQAGVGDLRRVQARQLRLDDRHVLLRAEWRADRRDSPPLAVASSFLLRRHDDHFEIVVYLNHTDLATALAPTVKENS